MTLELRALLAILGTYRVAELMAVDDGPFRMFLRFRVWCARKSKELSRLVACPWCVGIYIGLALSALVLWPTVLGDAILVVLGVIGGAAFLEGWAGRENNDL
jgi:hypothetical protein